MVVDRSLAERRSLQLVLSNASHRRDGIPSRMPGMVTRVRSAHSIGSGMRGVGASSTTHLLRAVYADLTSPLGRKCKGPVA